jgi:hypothetical protein
MIFLFALLVLLAIAGGVTVAPRVDALSRASGEAHLHRCDFCKEAILFIDDDARCFVQHAGPKPLLGYSVVNACGACAREHMVDGGLSFESADPSA